MSKKSGKSSRTLRVTLGVAGAMAASTTASAETARPGDFERGLPWCEVHLTTQERQELTALGAHVNSDGQVSLDSGSVDKAQTWAKENNYRMVLKGPEFTFSVSESQPCLLQTGDV